MKYNWLQLETKMVNEPNAGRVNPLHFFMYPRDGETIQVKSQSQGGIGISYSAIKS
jgi:hypothetical protein